MRKVKNPPREVGGLDVAADGTTLAALVFDCAGAIPSGFMRVRLPSTSEDDGGRTTTLRCEAGHELNCKGSAMTCQAGVA